MPASASAPSWPGDRQVCLDRLAHELALLLHMSKELQAGMHTLDLANSSPAARKVLQSADRLTQNLDCIKSVLIGISQSGEALAEPEDFLKDVYLHDMRQRLLFGAERTGPGNAALAGRLEIL